jgi:hypothetical protein
MKKIVIFTMLLVSALSSFGQAEAQSAETEIKAEACKVYQAVLANEKLLVISESSFVLMEFGKRWRFSKRNPKFAIVQPATIKSYQKASYWCEINDFVNLEPKKTLISRDEINSYFENLKINRDADLRFIEKYGTDHYYIFSNVGFNKKMDQALLTLKWQSISFTGSDTYYVVLSKMNGEWKVVRKEGIESS